MTTASPKKLTLKEFIWMGFNYTVGIGFIGNFAILANNDVLHAIGAHVIWIFLLEGMVAGICAFAFAKMARIHNSNNNGAAYIYVRGSYGRFWGWLVAFMQYISLPFIITVQILYLIRGTFSPEFAGHAWYSLNWGAFSDLYLDLLGIVIYLLAACTVFFGIKIYKKVGNVSGIVKWATAAFLVVAAIALAIGNGATSWQHWTTTSSLSFTGFMNTFVSCFFFFAGFELFATAGKNIANPQKNIGKGITLIILICTIFYIVISLIFFTAYSEFEQNMNMATWNAFHAKVILYGGPIIMIISSIALKVNVAMQNALYGGTVLQPLAKEGYISHKLFTLNRDGLPLKAITLNLVITIFMIILWLIIPDLIKGLWMVQHPGKAYKSALNAASLTAASSAITIFIYTMVVLTTLKLAFSKKITLKWWEITAFLTVLFFLTILLLWHYYSLIRGTLAALAKKPNESSPLVAMIVEILFIVMSLSFAIIWYYCYYLPKYRRRLQTNPQLQATLDKDFLLNI